MQVFQALARAIVDERVSTAFTLVGQANMHLVGALDAEPGVRVVHSPHEGTALGMAEGYRRASGRPTICLVTGGAALVNLSLSLVEAARSRTPLVVLTGRTPAGYRGSPQTFDHRQLAATMEVGYEEITDPGHALLVLAAAFGRAEAERRPIVLDIASDLQLAELPSGYDYRSSAGRATEAPAPVAPASALTAAAQRIAAARRPVILAGAGALESGARSEILALAERTGALLATTLPLHGWFGGEPANLGIIGMFAWPFALDLVRDSDCIIAVGASANRYTMQDTGTGRLSFAAADVVQIGLDRPAPLGDGNYAAVYVRGDARAAARGLLELLPEKRTGYRSAEVLEAIEGDRADWDPVRFELEPGRVDPRQLCDLLDRELPDNCGLTIATGHCWSWPIMHLTRWREPQLFAYHFGSIGVATAIGLGGSLGAPDRPMVIVEGDGSVLMNVQNLQTMARYRLPVLLVVLNDEAYGAELHQLLGRGLPAGISELAPADFAVLANAFGADGRPVTSTAEFAGAVRDFLADPHPMVLDCRVSQRVISVPSRRLDYRAKPVPA